MASLLTYQTLGWPPIAGAPFGIAAACLLAAVVGTPTFRLRGHYFTMATIAVAELVRIIVVNTPALGAAIGLSGPALPRTVFDLSFIDPRLLLLDLPGRSGGAAGGHGVADACAARLLPARDPRQRAGGGAAWACLCGATS